MNYFNIYLEGFYLLMIFFELDSENEAITDCSNDKNIFMIIMPKQVNRITWCRVVAIL